jgi:hypothetical protein
MCWKVCRKNKSKMSFNRRKFLAQNISLQKLSISHRASLGLAVTLCRLCWESGTRDVVLGTALARDVKLCFEPLLGHEATHSLACFSIGGSAGMTLEAVARLSGKNF